MARSILAIFIGPALAEISPSQCQGGIKIVGFASLLDGVYSLDTNVYKRHLRVPPTYSFLDTLFGFRNSSSGDHAERHMGMVLDTWSIVNQSACGSEQGDQHCLNNGPLLTACNKGCPLSEAGGIWPSNGHFQTQWHLEGLGLVNVSIQCCQHEAEECSACLDSTCHYFSECAQPDNPLAKKCCERKPYGLSFCGCKAKLPKCGHDFSASLMV
mmetsp:Transcript_88897/g.176835  ORF Transcript_88897/g.176835 Transcript_88897/m.176835 type:complete len:213 (-) Transcript_88897:61-699(-)